MDALAQVRAAQTPPRYAELLADAGVRPPTLASEQPSERQPVTQQEETQQVTAEETSAQGAAAEAQPADQGHVVGSQAQAGSQPASSQVQTEEAELAWRAAEFAQAELPGEVRPQHRHPAFAAIEETTPPQGTSSPFTRPLGVPSVPSAPLAPRVHTYPQRPPASDPAPPGQHQRPAPEPGPWFPGSLGEHIPDPAAPLKPVSQLHRAGPPIPHGLPQRVPAEPDVPRVPEPSMEPPAPAPALSRIASGLRRDDVPATDRPDGFDVAAVLSAVRDVPGVRDAQLRATPTGGHTLRLDLADGSDPAYVSRVVARMLNERMGLVAQPPVGESPVGEPRAAGAGAGAGRHAPDGRPGAPDDRSGQNSTARQETGPTGPDSGVRRGADRPSVMPSSFTEPADGPAAQGRAAAFPPTHRGGPPLPPGLIPASAAPREPRRRHPVTVRGRYPAEPRPGGLVSDDRRSDDSFEQGRSPALSPPTEPARRVVLDHVQVSTFGLDATVEVRLVAGERVALGVSNGPAVDGYVLRLCAAAAANAIDELLSEVGEESQSRGHCYVEQAAIVPMGSCEVAVVVILLVCNGWVEQLAGSALVSGDPRQAVVRATLAAVNRRLTALLS
jgi:hypothetical protein